MVTFTRASVLALVDAWPAAAAGPQRDATAAQVAVACGDKTVRVAPLPNEAAREGAAWASGQQVQHGVALQEPLLLWAGISDQVLCVAWHPLAPSEWPRTCRT